MKGWVGVKSRVTSRLMSGRKTSKYVILIENLIRKALLIFSPLRSVDTLHTEGLIQ